MIDINVAPGQTKRKKTSDLFAVGKNIPKEVIVGFVGGFFVLIVFLTVILQLFFLWRLGKLKVLDHAWNAEAPNRQEVEKVVKQKNELKKKLAAIGEITIEGRILWAPKLNAISNTLPKRVWLTKIAFDEGEVSIEGTAGSKKQTEISDVGSFAAALRQNEFMTKDLTGIEVGSIKRRKYNTLEVADFIITAQTQ